MAAGFDAAAFTAKAAAAGEPLTAFNAGLGATGPIQHLLITRAILRAHPEAQSIVYGFFDFMLTQPVQEDWRLLFGNNAMVFYTEPAIAARHETSSAFGRWAFQVVGGIPMFAERGAIWARVEQLRRDLGQLGLPPAAVNRFGRVEDFSPVENTTEGSRRVRTVENVASDVPLASPVVELLGQARERNVKVWVVSVPMPAAHRKHYASPEWQAYFTLLRGKLAAHGAELIDASDWVADDALFMDALHLGPEGAIRFSLRLAETIGAHR